MTVLLQIAVTFGCLAALGGLWYAVQQLTGGDISRPSFGCGGHCHDHSCAATPTHPAPADRTD